MDEVGGDAAVLGQGAVGFNQPRDIVLRRILTGDPFGPLKAQFYGNCLVNRYLDPLWNNEAQYFFGNSQFSLALLIAWKMAMVPSDPSAANVDWYFWSLSGGYFDETGPHGGHLLVYGTYPDDISAVANPNFNPQLPESPTNPRTLPLYYFGLPATIPLGTYWSSGHFAMWSSSISYIFGSNFFVPTSPERFAGSAYEAAKEYATATGLTLKLYVPSRFYYPLLNMLPAFVIPDIQPLPDLGDPGYDPNVHPKLYFKAEFFNGNGGLVDRWPDSYMIPPQYP